MRQQSIKTNAFTKIWMKKKYKSLTVFLVHIEEPQVIYIYTTYLICIRKYFKIHALDCHFIFYKFLERVSFFVQINWAKIWWFKKCFRIYIIFVAAPWLFNGFKASNDKFYTYKNLVYLCLIITLKIGRVIT